MGIESENFSENGDTRWDSHYGTLISVLTMFSSIVEVFKMIADDGACFG